MNLKEIREKYKSELFLDVDGNLLDDGAINDIQRETVKQAKLELIEILLKINFTHAEEKDDWFWDGYAFAIGTFKNKLTELKKEVKNGSN